MNKYGLVGNSLAHSFSKKYFTDKFKAENLDSIYENFEINNIEKVLSIVQQNQNLLGFNVTIPYKENIIPFLTEIDATASAVGAVNTVKVYNSNGEIKLKGFNTDVWGFEKSLLPILPERKLKALILGTGGASKAIAHVLKKLLIPFKFVSRTPQKDELTYQDLSEEVFNEYELIINTTPVGTLNDTRFLQLPYQAINEKYICYDLIYNPAETLFLKMAKQNGATIKNGLEMLQLQADSAWEIWQSAD